MINELCFKTISFFFWFGLVETREEAEDESLGFSCLSQDVYNMDSGQASEYSENLGNLSVQSGGNFFPTNYQRDCLSQASLSSFDTNDRNDVTDQPISPAKRARTVIESVTIGKEKIDISSENLQTEEEKIPSNCDCSKKIEKLEIDVNILKENYLKLKEQSSPSPERVSFSLWNSNRFEFCISVF